MLNVFCSFDIKSSTKRTQPLGRESTQMVPLSKAHVLHSVLQVPFMYSNSKSSFPRHCFDSPNHWYFFAACDIYGNQNAFLRCLKRITNAGYLGCHCTRTRACIDQRTPRRFHHAVHWLVSRHHVGCLVVQSFKPMLCSIHFAKD